MTAFYERLHEVFRRSDAVFYRYAGRQFSYRDAYEAMLRINSVLWPLRGKRVGLYGFKSFEAYSAIFSIILSGNTWVPISPDQPPGRVAGMLDLAVPELFLVESEVPKYLEDFSSRRGIPVFRLHELLRRASPAEFVPEGIDPHGVAYIMFTSGSTGTPKGVPLTHENYIQFIENALEILPFRRGEVFADHHDFGFDLSIFTIFCCALTESTFSPILRDEERLFPMESVLRNGVTVWPTVPTSLSRVARLRRNARMETPVRIMFLCGEPFRLDLLRYCYDSLGLEHVYNFYGLTETGVENFYHECDREDLGRFESRGFVPIGLPMRGNQARISEENELWISGCQVTPGYLGGVGNERFKVVDDVRWFRTGDLVERSGALHFCKGRMDWQVKLAGHRVELMEIEAQIRRLPNVEEALCFVEAAGESPTLVCALQTKGPVDARAMAESLKKMLPRYMIPRKYYPLEEVPRNSSGKIDRNAVPRLCLGRDPSLFASRYSSSDLAGRAVG